MNYCGASKANTTKIKTVKLKMLNINIEHHKLTYQVVRWVSTHAKQHTFEPTVFVCT